MLESILGRRFGIALLTLATPLNALAADGEVEQLRQQLQQLKDMMKALEIRLEKAETQAVAAQTRAQKLEESGAQASTPPPVSRPATGANASNPAVSLILQGRYANLPLDADPLKPFLAGFQRGGEIGRGERGFSLAESELTIAASVDPYFSGLAIFSISPENTIQAEEAFVQTTAVGHGFNIKAGRFFSGLGYLNEIHQHAWDFIDAPLVYQAFLGGQQHIEGMQLRWVAPLESVLLELGADVGFVGRRRNGFDAGAVHAHLGGDLGDSWAYRIGLSALRTHPNDPESAQQFTLADAFGNASLNSYSGETHLMGADFVFKWAPNGNPKETNLKLQGEYFRRREDGQLTYDSDAALGLTQTDAYRTEQSGWYLQAAYQFAPEWRVGLRTEQLMTQSSDFGSNAVNLGLDGFKPRKHSLMFDWSPTEFSRLRLQFANDYATPGEVDRQVFLQYLMSVGAHGGHKF